MDVYFGQGFFFFSIHEGGKADKSTPLAPHLPPTMLVEETNLKQAARPDALDLYLEIKATRSEMGF